MSELEEGLLFHIRALRLPDPVREHRFSPARRWRFDFAWPDRMVAVEVEGGIWVRGAHSRGAHFNSDCEKYNEATLLGWKVLRVSTDHIRRGQAVDWIERSLKASPVS